MTKTILIASLLAPRLKDWEEFVQVLKQQAADFKVVAGRIGVCEGPGCCNLTIEATGTKKDIETLGNNVCFAMMPSKWSYTSDEPLDGYHLTK